MSVIDKAGWIHTKPRKNILSRRDFYGDEFFIWSQQQYEESRVFLKKCGRPKDEYEKFLAEEAKFSSKFFRALITDEDAKKPDSVVP